MRKFIYCLAYCLGSILYGLISAGTGALIPIKAKELTIPQTDFSSTMAFRGIGGVIGAFIGIFVQKYLSMHTTMGICFLLMGGASFTAGIADHIWIFTMSFCLVELCGILSMICSNVAILRLFEVQKKNQAWIKAYYMSFAIGAFLTPIMVNLLGVVAYEIYPIIAGLLVIFMFIIKEPKLMSINIMQEVQPINQPVKEIPLSFNILLASFLMIYSGGQASYSGWISSFGTIGNRIPVDQSLYAMSIFWISKSVGRAAVIPLSYLMSTIRQLYLFVSGCIVVLTTCVTLNFFGYYKVVLYFGSACAGICMSGIYPLTITVPNSYGMQASSKNTSQYILGSCIGFGATPYLVGLLMDQFGPDMLFVCEWVTALIMLILLFKVTLVGRKYQQNIKNTGEAKDANNGEQEQIN